MKKWTKKCKCGNFIPDNYELCDSCLLNKYELHPTYGMGEIEVYLLERNDVIKALRKAIEEALIEGFREGNSAGQTY